MPRRLKPRGGPLLTLVAVFAGWGVLRAAAWENPFAPPVAALEHGASGLAYAPRSLADPYLLAAFTSPNAAEGAAVSNPSAPRRARPLARGAPRSARSAARQAPPGPDHSVLSGPRLPDARESPWRSPPPPSAQQSDGRSPEGFEQEAPFAPRRPLAAGRWSLDAWGFWRQGSDAAPVSQGRVPIYGASQAGAVLQYRLAPASRRDPRLYARAYRALVKGGESELAIGASLRPLVGLPLRLAGEGRFTDTPFGSEVRPAAYAVTEINPVSLPLGTRLEIYGQSGWVGGRGRTPFADGQASLTRDLPFAGRLSKDAVRISIGAGAWGGAQKDAQRLDVGPTLRADVGIGGFPARLSVDWRARVAGDAAPGSGVAATLSAGF